MEFTLVDQFGNAARVVICPHQVTFILGDCNEEAPNQRDAEITYKSVHLLAEISSLVPDQDSYWAAAAHNNAVLGIRRFTPAGGDWPIETVELHVGSPRRHGASLCLPMTTLRALLTTHAVVP